jgi:hypothetical protein
LFEGRRKLRNFNFIINFYNLEIWYVINTWGPMTSPPIAKAARASEKKRRRNYKKFLFFGLLLGFPLQQQQQQHWNNHVKILKFP